MARIRPDRIRYCKEMDFYWILNGNTDEIRPYRILIKKIPTSEMTEATNPFKFVVSPVNKKEVFL